MEYIIKEYLKKLEINDIKNFAIKNNIELTDNDAIILYTYAKKYYQELINGDESIIKELKQKLSSDTFKKAYKLYLEYKLKYLK